MPAVPALRALGVALACAVTSACGATRPDPQEVRYVDWHPIEWSGGTTNVAVLSPQEVGAGPHPVVFALPWGSGSANLVMSFLEAYWSHEPGRRGYYVVAPEVTGPTLADIGDELLPAIFSWMDAELPYDPSQVALVGASNGGRGMFHAALSQPERFRALIGLPGEYSGEPQNLTALAGKPVWLLVGEFDGGWVEASQSTAAALEAAGAKVTLDIVPAQEHVLLLSSTELMDWIDGALGR
jgi:pimeloyl-ACP methyl ester carboxylesterase